MSLSSILTHSISASIPPLTEGMSTSMHHLFKNPSYKKTDNELIDADAISNEEDYSKEFKKYEIISSPSFLGIVLIIFLMNRETSCSES